MDEQQGLIGLDFGISSRELIEVLIEDPSEPEIFLEIARANTNRPEILELLAAHPALTEEARTFIAGILTLPVPGSTALAGTKTRQPAAVQAHQDSEMKAYSILQKIQSLTVAQRLQLAMKGGREIRGILIKDTNKEVMLSVLENQKITETEIENIARSRSVPDEILRRIAHNREWMKNYAIIHALVTNPKTPPGISVGLVGNLKTRDIVILEKNRNVPDVIRTAAKRLLNARKPK